MSPSKPVKIWRGRENWRTGFRLCGRGQVRRMVPQVLRRALSKHNTAGMYRQNRATAWNNTAANHIENP